MSRFAFVDDCGCEFYCQDGILRCDYCGGDFCACACGGDGGECYGCEECEREEEVEGE